jgi:hypothetical protein
VPATVEAAYTRGLTALLSLAPGSDEEGNAVPHTLTLAPEAFQTYLAFVDALEPRLGPAGDLSHMADWASKLTGLVCRYAGLLHVAERFDDPAPWATPIAVATMANATKLGMALIPHALRVFDELQVDTVITDARTLLAKIKEWRDPEGADIMLFSRRDLHQKVRRTIKTSEAVEAGLRILFDHGYVRPIGQAPSSAPGRKSDLYEVNPRIGTQNTQNRHFEDSVYSLEPRAVGEEVIEDEGEVVA